MRPAEDIVADIDTILKEVWQHLEDPENLSKDILKLAVLNGGIGNWLAEAQDLERRVEAAYKHDVDRKKLDYVKAGDSATVSESKAKLDLAEQMDAWLDAQHQVTVLKLKRQDTDQAIDAARSRLSLIKQDIKQGQA